MAWKERLQDASFRGVRFDVAGTEDGRERALSIHEYPYRNGGEVVDLGARVQRLSVDAILWGADYEARLERLLAALDAGGVGELIHPIWGSLRVFVAAYRVRHSAPEPDACTVRLDLVEATEPSAIFAGRTAGQKAAAIGQCRDRATAATAGIVAAVIAAVLSGRPAALLGPLRTLMQGPLLAARALVPGTVLSGLDALAQPTAWAADLGALTDGLLGARPFAAVAGALDSPLMADWRSVTGALGVFDAYGLSGTVPGLVRLATGALPSVAQAMDAARVMVGVSSATAHGEAAALVLGAEAETPTLSPPEIETVANAARERLDGAIEAARSVFDLEQGRAIAEPLRDQALALQDAAAAIIEARPPLVERTMALPGNLRLIAHALYGDHARAAELYRLNALRTPNGIERGEVLRAYAR